MGVVLVTVGGVSRCDVGHGQGHSKSAGDAHDSAVKEAVTDGLKRGLRTFGNTFGLALYEKNVSAREVGYIATKRETEAAISAIMELPDMDALKTYWSGLYGNARHVADHADVVSAKDKRKTELTQKEAA